MSTFTEDQIRSIVQNELRRIIDAGLLYTTGTTTPTPTSPRPPIPSPKTNSFKEATIKNTVAQLDGSIKPIHFINDKELWNQINDDLVLHGFKWVSAGKESRWQK